MTRYRMTITIEMPYEATRAKNRTAAGSAMLRAAQNAQSGADVLLGVLGVALMDAEARAYAVACGDVPEDVAPFMPVGERIEIEEVPDAD